MPGVQPTPINYSPLVDELVTQRFLTDNWENTKRKRVLTEYLQKNECFTTNDDAGKYIELKAHIGEFAAAYRAELAIRTFARVNHDVTYTAPYSFYETKAVLSEEDMAFLNTRQAITKLGMKIITRLSDDMYKGFNRELLRSNAGTNTVAGLAAAATNPVPLYGFPTLFGYGSTAIGYNPDTQTSTISAVSAADREVLPNVAYCGISTHPTNAISGVDGKLNESTSPVIVNTTSTGFPSASSTFQTNCLEVFSHIISRLGMRDSDAEGFPDIGLQTFIMHNKMRAKLRSSTTGMLMIGDKPLAPDVGLCPRLYIPFEGINIFPDTDMPTDVLYVLNSKKIQIDCVPQMPAGMADGKLGGDAKPMFKIAQMPDIDTGAYKVVAKIMCNMLMNPRYAAMGYAFA